MVERKLRVEFQTGVWSCYLGERVWRIGLLGEIQIWESSAVNAVTSKGIDKLTQSQCVEEEEGLAWGLQRHSISAKAPMKDSVMEETQWNVVS